MEGNTPRTVEEVFKDFRGRRAGVIRALTSDVESFYRQCDPACKCLCVPNFLEVLVAHNKLCQRYFAFIFVIIKEKDNLCLYGLPNETWEVNLPVEEVPPEIPEPALGINFARDGMQEKDWLSLVAVHSDSWLLAVAFYFGSRFSFGRNDRKRLFQMINELPTVFEVLTGNVKQPNDQSENHNGGSRNKSSIKPHQPENHNKGVKTAAAKEEESGEEEEEEAEEQGRTLCGVCGDDYGRPDEFWICCDICEKWFHGKCVKITPAKAEHMKQYKCPGCTSKRPRV